MLQRRVKMCDAILLDDACLKKGLPPLSMGVNSAYKMISKMEPGEKRKVLRRVRKITKVAIRSRCAAVKNMFKRKVLEHSLLRQANLLKEKKQAHQAHFVCTRLRMVKSHIEAKNEN